MFGSRRSALPAAEPRTADAGAASRPASSAVQVALERRGRAGRGGRRAARLRGPARAACCGARSRTRWAARSSALRAEIASLRGELLEKVGGQLRLERIETTRVIGSDLEALQHEVRQLKVAAGRRVQHRHERAGRGTRRAAPGQPDRSSSRPRCGRSAGRPSRSRPTSSRRSARPEPVRAAAAAARRPQPAPPQPQPRAEPPQPPPRRAGSRSPPRPPGAARARSPPPTPPARRPPPAAEPVAAGAPTAPAASRRRPSAASPAAPTAAGRVRRRRAEPRPTPAPAPAAAPLRAAAALGRVAVPPADARPALDRDDPFASLPRLSPFADDEPDPAPRPAERRPPAGDYRGRRRRARGAGRGRRAAGRHGTPTGRPGAGTAAPTTSDEDDDLLARLLAREGAR